MNQEDLFDLWAAPFRDWSPWAKPIAFAVSSPIVDALSEVAIPSTDVSWAPAAKDTVIVVDLPGPASIYTGLALIHRGYWPVPLFNAAGSNANALVDMDNIRYALWQGARVLQDAPVDPHYRPAFLLDANRMPVKKALPGQFDNRWLTLPQDFPSANLLLSRGIRKAIVRQDAQKGVRDDLAHVLLRWQKAGITINIKPQDGPPCAAVIAKPSSFRAWWYVALVLMGLRSNIAGGFGSAVPIQTGGGFGG